MIDKITVEMVCWGMMVIGIGLTTLSLYVIDWVREQKKKKLKPTPRPNRVPYDSRTFRR